MACPDVAEYFIGRPALGCALTNLLQPAAHFGSPRFLDTLFRGLQTLQKRLRQECALRFVERKCLVG